MSMISIILALSLIVGAHSRMTIVDLNAGSSEEFDVYHGLQWDEIESQKHTNISPLSALMPLIPLDSHPNEDFDPCDESTYTLDEVVRQWYTQKNLTTWSRKQRTDTLTAADTDRLTEDEHDTPWIAFHDYSTIFTRCGGSTPLHLYYNPYVTLMAQRLGASAGMFAYCPHFTPFHRVSRNPTTDI